MADRDRPGDGSAWCQGATIGATDRGDDRGDDRTCWSDDTTRIRHAAGREAMGQTSVFSAASSAEGSVLTLIDGRWRGTALEQAMDRLPGGAGRVFDSERYLLRNFRELAEQAEVGCSLGDRAGPVDACARHPDAVHVGQIAGDADRRRHDRIELLIEPQVPQHLLEDFRAGAGIAGFPDKVAGAAGIQQKAPPQPRAGRLADDFGLVEDRHRHQPARVLQRHKTAASWRTACQRRHLVEELGPGRGDREGHPLRVGHVCVTEEHVGIAEIGAPPRQALPQRPVLPAVPRRVAPPSSIPPKDRRPAIRGSPARRRPVRR